MTPNGPTDSSEASKESILVADIGGTNARFALANFVQGKPVLRNIAIMQCADYANIDEAIVSYLANTNEHHCRSASFAVAGPVNQQRVEITNNHWYLDKVELPAKHQFDKCKLINDFTAMALGVSALNTEQLTESDDHDCATRIADTSKPCLVIGPGTGLGVSALVPILDKGGKQSGWIPLATEGGHIAFAPTDDYEARILDYLSNKFSRVSVERLICGEGMSNLYEACSFIDKGSAEILAPEEITRRASSQPLAKKVIMLFCKLLGQVAGDGALMIGAQGGVYICGGIIPRILSDFHQSEFREAFESKGRMKKFVAQIPTYVVMEPHTGLLGAALALENPHV